MFSFLQVSQLSLSIIKRKKTSAGTCSNLPQASMLIIKRKWKIQSLSTHKQVLGLAFVLSTQHVYDVF